MILTPQTTIRSEPNVLLGETEQRIRPSKLGQAVIEMVVQIGARLSALRDP